MFTNNYILFNACSKMVQAFSISSFEIIKGGEMRNEFDANKNQSVITPPELVDGSIHLSITFLLRSKESNSTAIHRPKERIDLTFG